MGLAGAAGQLVESGGRLFRDLRKGCGEEAEGALALKLGVTVQLMPRKAHELTLELAENGL